MNAKDSLSSQEQEYVTLLLPVSAPSKQNTNAVHTESTSDKQEELCNNPAVSTSDKQAPTLDQQAIYVTLAKSMSNKRPNELGNSSVLTPSHDTIDIDTHIASTLDSQEEVSNNPAVSASDKQVPILGQHAICVTPTKYVSNERLNRPDNSSVLTPGHNASTSDSQEHGYTSGVCCSKQTRIVLFGTSGSGKSTIANMLVQHMLKKTNNVSNIGNDFKGVTTTCTIYESDKYQIVDTIGIGETEKFGRKSSENAVIEICKYLTSIGQPFDHICFVKKAGSFTVLDKVYWNIFSSLFKGCESNFVMIVTQADIDWVIANKEDVRHIIKLDVNMVAVDFPPISNKDNIEILYRSIRETNLLHLENFLSCIRSNDSFSVATPSYDYNIIHYSIKKTFSRFAKSVHSMKELLMKPFGIAQNL